MRDELARLPPKSEVWLRPGTLPHPSEAGAARSLGLPRGQLRDWRFAPNPDASGVHVHEMHGGVFAAHLDRVHPDAGLVAHLRADAPEVLLAGGPLVGAAVGLLVGRPGLFFTIGAAIGALLVFGGDG